MGKITLANDKMQFSKELHDDRYQLENVFGLKPEQLTSKLILMGAEQDAWYPVTLMTEGQRKIRRIKETSIEYDYPVIDSTRRGAIRISNHDYSGNDKPGLNNSFFALDLEDLVIVNYTYLLQGDLEIYCHECEELATGGWRGTFQIMDQNLNGSFVPLSAITIGKKIGTGVAVVSMAASRGNGSRFATPYKKKNMINMYRKTYKTEGEVAKEVISFNYTSDDGTADKFWMDFRKWQWRQEWNQEKEIGGWVGHYNKRPDGVIPVKDPRSGNPAQRGSGLFEQVYNKHSYGFLSARFLEDLVMQLFHGTTGAAKKELTLFTGILGRRFFDAAMKELMGSERFLIDSNKVITGTPGNLEFNYGFTSYRTPDGHRISVNTHPMFDEGPLAEIADVYQGKLTTESARMMFLDTTNYNGEANLQVVIPENWDERRQKVAGVGRDTEGVINPLVSSDIHASSEEYMTRRGFEILRATNCLDLRFKAA